MCVNKSSTKNWKLLSSSSFDRFMGYQIARMIASSCLKQTSRENPFVLVCVPRIEGTKTLESLAFYSRSPLAPFPLTFSTPSRAISTRHDDYTPRRMYQLLSLDASYFSSSSFFEPLDPSNFSFCRNCPPRCRLASEQTSSSTVHSYRCR